MKNIFMVLVCFGLLSVLHADSRTLSVEMLREKTITIQCARIQSISYSGGYSQGGFTTTLYTTTHEKFVKAFNAPEALVQLTWK